MLEGDATSTVGIQIDIKSEMMVKKRAGVNGGVQLEGFKPVGQGGGPAALDRERDLTEFEQECLAKFEKNDEEID